MPGVTCFWPTTHSWRSLEKIPWHVVQNISLIGTNKRNNPGAAAWRAVTWISGVGSVGDEDAALQEFGREARVL